MTETPEFCALPSCGKKLFDSYLVTPEGKMHRGCAGSPVARRTTAEERADKAADAYEREIESRFP